MIRSEKEAGLYLLDAAVRAASKDADKAAKISVACKPHLMMMGNEDGSFYPVPGLDMTETKLHLLGEKSLKGLFVDSSGTWKWKRSDIVPPQAYGVIELRDSTTHVGVLLGRGALNEVAEQVGMPPIYSKDELI